MSSATDGLRQLEARLATDLDYLELPSKSWVPPRHREGQRVWDVLFIGAGMCGLAGAARLKLAGVDNVVLYDAAPAGLEGPWETFARMQTLRSPKSLSGPALGLPSLTFRAWYTAQYGVDGWEALDKIPKGQWMDYLRWYRRVLGLPVVNETRMTGLADAGDGLVAVSLYDGTGERVEYCRHLVLATGRSGLGGGVVPGFLDGIDKRFWAHSADPVDFAALAGKRVIVIGAGASAMDNAATALESGAAQVDMLIRRKEMPRVNKMTGIGSQGVVHGMRVLPDAWKYRFVAYVNDQQVPPPRSSTLRVTRHENARLFLGCPVETVTETGDHVVAKTPFADFPADFIIAATGFRNDFDGRAELAAIAPHIKTWGDGPYRPEMGPTTPFMVDAPYLGESFEFLEKSAGDCPMLARIHCFNDAAMLSHGKLSGDIPAISAGADRLMRGIVSELFVADRKRHFEALEAYDIPELEGDEWTDSTPSLTEAAE
ncbi:NAD(P)-binding domain-containing protein [Tropicimonas sp. IMCC6043]|uniref:NAD(P)-binding domain-containing protein n=1 Tax=Tropicimonas sp. IMCC6043 TaxID=2510645 RepID=UPI00101B6C27|nr:NAD(P)/FAD-dependent oxidoreductase [Tropicimonas sp. IMCC6043]RYH12250.1 NAD(P)/FAD-dependent oxidoreductase [Tropicimonas sp. IMCC6043]